MTRPGRPPASVATQAAGAAPRVAPVQRKMVTKGAAKSAQDGQIVTSLIVAFVLLVVAVASVSVRGNMRLTKSREAMTGTLKAVHERQSTFRLLNQRFATWRELEARGMVLPPEQSVVKSNATESHWFVSVRDSATGVICDKTGELFDEGPDDHVPLCRDPAK